MVLIVNNEHSLQDRLIFNNDTRYKTVIIIILQEFGIDLKVGNKLF